MKRKFYMGSLGVLCLLALAACKTTTVGSYDVIPLPQEIIVAKGEKPFVWMPLYGLFLQGIMRK